MLSKASTWIKNQPLETRLAAWPFYFLTWAITQITSKLWAAAGRKIGLWRWPVAILFGLLILVAVSSGPNQEAFIELAGKWAALIVALYGFRVIFSGFRKPKKKKP